MDGIVHTRRRNLIEFLQWLSTEMASCFPSLTVEAQNVRKWAEDLEQMTYKIAFVGTFSVGKSTLLNALLEEELFPMHILLTTPTAVLYRHTPGRARVVLRQQGQPEEEVLLDVPAPEGGTSELAHRVYRVLQAKFDELNACYREVDTGTMPGERPPFFEIEVGYPLGSHADGLLLVDMPGTEDLSVMRRDIVLTYLPRMDAVVFVFNAGQPMSEGERKFLRTLWHDYGLRTIFPVLNKIDTIPTSQEREATRERVAENIRAEVGQPLPVYPLSSFWALTAVRWRKEREGKLSRDHEETELEAFLRFKYKGDPEALWADSGVEELRRDIWRFVESDERWRKKIERIKTKVEQQVFERMARRIEQTRDLLDTLQRELETLRLKAKEVEHHLDILKRTQRQVEATARPLPNKWNKLLEEEVGDAYLEMAERVAELVLLVAKEKGDKEEKEKRIVAAIEDAWLKFWRERLETVAVQVQNDINALYHIAQKGVQEAGERINLEVPGEITIDPPPLDMVKELRLATEWGSKGVISKIWLSAKIMMYPLINPFPSLPYIYRGLMEKEIGAKIKRIMIEHKETYMSYIIKSLDERLQQCYSDITNQLQDIINNTQAQLQEMRQRAEIMEAMKREKERLLQCMEKKKGEIEKRWAAIWKADMVHHTPATSDKGNTEKPIVHENGERRVVMSGTVSSRDRRRALIAFLQEMRQRLQEYEEFKNQAQNVKKWAEDLEQMTYRIAFVGTFSVGKSTLLNALLEEELFPMHILPTTPTAVLYHRAPGRARVVLRQQEQPEEEVLLDVPAPEGGTSELAHRVYRVLQAKFEELNARYKEVNTGTMPGERPPFFEIEVGYPLGPHADGLLLVDMPGTEDLSVMRRDIVLTYLPRMDAVVFVFNAGQPMSEGERKFLRTLWHDYGLRTIFPVLNKIDTIPTSQEREAARERVAESIRAEVGQPLPVYPLSSFWAVTAVRWRKEREGAFRASRGDERTQEVTKMEKFLHYEYKGDPEALWADSGVEELRRDIWRFVESDERWRKKIERIKIKVEQQVFEYMAERIKKKRKLLETPQKDLETLRLKAKEAENYLDILKRTQGKIKEKVEELPKKWSKLLEDKVSDDYREMAERVAELALLVAKEKGDKEEKEKRIVAIIEDAWFKFWRERLETVVVQVQNDINALYHQAQKGVQDAEERINRELPGGITVDLPPLDMPEELELSTEWWGKGTMTSLATITGLLLAGPAGAAILAMLALIPGHIVDRREAEKNFKNTVSGEIIENKERTIDHITKHLLEHLQQCHSDITNQLQSIINNVQKQLQEIKQQAELTEAKKKEKEKDLQRMEREKRELEERWAAIWNANTDRPHNS